MIELAGTVSKAWMAASMGASYPREYYFDPEVRHATDVRCQEYLDERFGDLGLFYTESNLGRRAFWYDRHVLVGGIQPNMIVGMLLGAEFVADERMDADITPHLLAGRSPDELPPVESLLDHELIHLFERQFCDIKRNGALEPVPPFFWDGSGRAAVHGALTSAQKFFGESVFLDMPSDPGRCRAVFDWITDVSIALVRHFACLAERPIDEIHVGECSGCMVSPVLYESLVVPTLSRVGRELGPVRLHSCGASNHLLKAAGEIENIAALDLGGDTSIDEVRAVFGSEFPICVAPLVQDMRDEEPQALLDWADRVLAANAGGPLVIGYHLEPGYSLDHLRRLHERVGAG